LKLVREKDTGKPRTETSVVTIEVEDAHTGESEGGEILLETKRFGPYKIRNLTNLRGCRLPL
jgi:hypothetical protein